MTEFHNSKSRKDGKWPYCRTCSTARATAWYHANKHSDVYQAGRTVARLKRFGLTEDAYRDILEQQGGGCAGCGATEDLVIDHDHGCCPSHRGSCGRCVRGILCQRCNRILGNVNDDMQILIKLAAYLARGELIG